MFFFLNTVYDDDDDDDEDDDHNKSLRPNGRRDKPSPAAAIIMRWRQTNNRPNEQTNRRISPSRKAATLRRDLVAC